MKLAKGRQPTKVAGRDRTARDSFMSGVTKIVDALRSDMLPEFERIGSLVQCVTEEQGPFTHNAIHDVLKQEVFASWHVVTVPFTRLLSLPEGTQRELKQIFPHSADRLYVVSATTINSGRRVLICLKPPGSR
jgi:hypothetical protein